MVRRLHPSKAPSPIVSSCDFGGDFDGLEAVALPEDAVPNLRDVVGNGDGLEVGALCKGIPRNCP